MLTLRETWDQKPDEAIAKSHPHLHDDSVKRKIGYGIQGREAGFKQPQVIIQKPKNKLMQYNCIENN